jgi:integrase
MTTQAALEWAMLPTNIKQRQRAVRLGVVRRFAEYLSAIDPRTEIPAQKLLPFQYRRPTPCLYKDEEVIKLIKAVGQIDSQNPFKCATYRTLFGLLAVTGMRAGEAIALDFKDVSFDQGLLTIPRAKGNKARLVPLHSSTTQALKLYTEARRKCFPPLPSSSFFVSERGTRLYYSTVNRWFLITSRRIGLRNPGADHGIRLHDLRHRFAIQTLLNWYRTDVNVGVHLPELATYLGHVHVNNTYWYLSATPELLQLATLRWQRAEGGRLK